MLIVNIAFEINTFLEILTAVPPSGFHDILWSKLYQCHFGNNNSMLSKTTLEQGCFFLVVLRSGYQRCINIDFLLATL